MAKKKKAKKDRQARALGTMASALVQAGLVSETDARKKAQGKRREDKVLGRKQVQEREQQRQAEEEARRHEEAEAARAAELARAKQEAEEEARGTVRKHMLPGSSGRRRWFFVAREGLVPFIDVSDEVASQLASGTAGIVESLGASPDAHVVVTGSGPLATLYGHDEGIVRFWNRPSGGA